MSQGERIRVAIIGAGVAGLTLAVALNTLDNDHRITIDLYEAAPELEEIGAGINVWPRTWELFKKLGLENTLTPLFDHLPDLEPRIIFGVRKADQKIGFKIYDVMNEGGALRIHRADLQKGLIDHLPLPGSVTATINSPCKLHLSHRVVDYSSSQLPASGPITIHFADKSRAVCDILVAADGIKSNLRQLFLSRLPDLQKYERFQQPKWSGLVAYRGLVAREALQKALPGHRMLEHPGVMYSGKDKYAVVYPVSNGRFFNVVAIVREKPEDAEWKGPWKVEVSQREFLDVYAGWDEEVQALIKCIERPTRWALQHLDHLNIFARGRVFLMGDSAHAMLPHLGAGASIGIEDAYIFASLLTHPSTPRVPSTQFINRIADIYNTNRVPRAIAMSKSTIQTGYLCDFETLEFAQFREGDEIPKHLLLGAARGIEKNWLWTTSDAEETRQNAIGLLVDSDVRAML